MQEFIEVFRQAIESVLSQCSGTPWTVQETEFTNASTEHRIAMATSSNSLAGTLEFRFDAPAGAALAQALLMSPEPAAQFGAEEREAVEELARQICGVAATALRPQFSEVSFQVPAQSSIDTPTTSRFFALQRDGLETTLELVLDSTLTSALQVRTVETDRPALRQALANRNLELLLDVRLGVRLRFGSRRMRLREVLELHPGTVVELDRQVQEPVELLVDTKLIAKGEVVVIDGNYGLRISDVVAPRELAETLQ
jgi:flagellar motor switch protein FliN/FliY